MLQVKPDHLGQYSFTLFVAYLLEMFNQFYDRMVTFVKDSELNKSQIHDHLSSLLERIIAVYGGILVSIEQPLQIAQGETNLQYCELIWKHFSEQLESKYEYIRNSEPGYKEKLETAIVEMRRQMREVVEDKILEIMCSYEDAHTWISPTINTSPN